MADELGALAPYELGALLSDIDRESLQICESLVDLLRALGRIESAIIDGSDTTRESKGLVAKAKRDVQALHVALRGLKSRQSRIQTILRAIP